MKVMKRIGNIISNCILIMLILAVLAVVIPKLFKIEIRAVVSGSMSPRLEVGDLVYAVPTPYEKIEKGDIITYVLNEQLTVVTHRVEEIDDENRRFYTKGDANNVQDGAPVLYDNILGVVKLSVPKVGHLLILMDNVQYRIIAVTALIAIILLMLIVKINTKEIRPEHPKEAEPRQIPIVTVPPPEIREIAVSGEERKEHRKEKRHHDPPLWSSLIFKAVLVLALCLVLFGTTVSMLRQMTREVSNPFDLANTEIEIEEPGVDPEEVEWGTDTKKVMIRNAEAPGKVPCLVRVMILPVFVDIQTGNYTGGNLNVLTAPTGGKLVLGDFTLHFNPQYDQYWYFNTEDGYFYYTGVLDVGDVTPWLLTGITLTDQSNAAKYQDVKIEVQVFADSLQAGGSAPADWGITISDEGTLHFNW